MPEATEDAEQCEAPVVGEKTLTKPAEPVPSVVQEDNTPGLEESFVVSSGIDGGTEAASQQPDKNEAQAESSTMSVDQDKIDAEAEPNSGADSVPAAEVLKSIPPAPKSSGFFCSSFLSCLPANISSNDAKPLEKKPSKQASEGLKKEGGAESARLYSQQLSSRPIILVFGATGKQGGSVFKHLLARGMFRVRAVTRYPETIKGRELRAFGCEVVKADFDDFESLVRACQGVHGVFSVQNYGEVMDLDKEVAQGKNVVLAAKEAKVQHFVYSSLEHVSEISGGRITAAKHFDSKGMIEKFAWEEEMPMTVIRPSFYYENFLDPTYWKITSDGMLVISLPMSTKPFYMFSVEDLGGIVAKVFEKPNEYIGKTVGVAGDFLTGPFLVRTFMKVTQKAARYEAAPYSSLKKAGFPGATERADMFRFFQEFQPQRDINECRKIYPQLMTWEKWLKRTGWQGPPREKLLLRP
mmetsp:Transcript_26172/g.45010  ORF Transcript_26172/g.45010 Transcript_26172/m.45010 type:complete len:467 (-) Transcript_26172:91-1491(-)